MNLLKPEVTVRKPNRYLNNIIIGFVASLVTSIVMNIGFCAGYDMGRQDATMTDRPVEDVACGISAPLDCVLSIVKSGARLLAPVRHTLVGPGSWVEYGDATYATCDITDRQTAPRVERRRSKR